MRAHTIKPAREITELALSPDGQRFGVVQSYHGFRLYDAVTGAEVGDPPEHGYRTADSPTGRHFLSAPHAQIRLAELSAGRPWAPFQSGWTRDGNSNRPPIAPDTLPVPTSYLVRITIGARILDPEREPPRPTPTLTEWAFLNGALSADHRLAIGRIGMGDGRVLVCDLAREVFVASDLDLSASPASTAVLRAAFTGDGARILVITLSTLFVFDLPPVGPDAPVLKPTVVIHATQPQPNINPIPPFAVLPCGQKVLIRGAQSRVELRDLATGELLTAWKFLRKVNALAVAADGLTAASAGANGRVVMWDLG